MARPKKIREEDQDQYETEVFERTMYEKEGKFKPAKWKAIADQLQAAGWTKV